MTTTPLVRAARPVAIPLRDVQPWAILGGLVLMLAIYFVGAEEGATGTRISAASSRRRASRTLSPARMLRLASP